MSIAPGTRMGSYEIGDLLGAGGMGTVYRAHDTRLKRDVAIKVLSEEVTHDRERLARFEPAETPPTIRRLLARCLERDPKERLHDAGDARLEIDEAIAERRPGTTSQIARIDVLEPRRSWSRRSLVPLLIVAVVGAGIGFFAGRRPAPVAKVANTPMRSVIPLPAGLAGLAGWPSPVVALSRDGRSLAYVAVKEDDRTQRVWVRNMETDETRMVPDSESGEGPFFSPDGTWLAFAVDVSGSPRPGQLRKFSLATGLTQLVAPIPDYFGGDWADDGTILVVPHSTKGPWLLPAAGGQPNTSAETVIVGGKKEERNLVWPQQLARGRTALFTDGNASAWGNASLLDLSTRELHDLQVVAPFARYTPTGHLLTLQPDGTLLATPFDVPTRKANGPSVAVLKGVAFSGNAAGVLAFSDSGSLVYGTGYLRGSGRELRKLARVTFSGEVELLPFEADTFTTAARLSPDGRRIGASTWEGSQWIYDLARGSRSRLPPGKTGRGTFVLWTPDGEQIVFSTYVQGHPGESIVRQKADGSAAPEVLIAGGAEKFAVAFTPDGGTLVFHQYGSPDEEGLWLLPVTEKGPPRRLIGGRALHAALSLDGRWIAYSSTESGTSEIFAQSFPTPGKKVQVSVGESGGPEWSTDGRSIVYRSAGSFFRVSVTAGDHLVVSPPEKLFERIPGVAGSTIAPDGNGFLALVRPPDSNSGIVRELHLVTNWFNELERLAPARSRK